MNKTLTKIKKEFYKKYVITYVNKNGEIYSPNEFLHENPDEVWDWIESTISQTKQELHKTKNDYCCACDYDIAVMEEKIKKAKQELIEQLDDIIELWFAVHDKTTKSFMTDDFRKFVNQKLNNKWIGKWDGFGGDPNNPFPLKIN